MANQLVIGGTTVSLTNPSVIKIEELSTPAPQVAFKFADGTQTVITTAADVVAAPAVLCQLQYALSMYFPKNRPIVIAQ